jgi:hypothetical protein
VGKKKPVTHGTRINITTLLEKGNEIILNCCKMNGTSVLFQPLEDGVQICPSLIPSFKSVEMNLHALSF